MTQKVGAVVFISSLILGVSLLGNPRFANADTTATLQDQVNAHTAEIAQLNAEIAQYEAKIKQANSDKVTLQSTINKLELQKKSVQSQISVTQNKIAATQLQIQRLGQSIDSLQSAIDLDQSVLAKDLRAVQANDAVPLITRLLSSGSLSTAWNDADTLTQLNQGIRDDVATLAAQKTALAVSRSQSQKQQAALADHKKTLTSQKSSLTQTTNQKSQLLAETKASEAQFQKLLEKAKAELASFSTFAQNAGGSGLLANQTSCDSWGCYYNQRDSQWGNDPLNGTKYHLKSDGCLVTSVAMVMTHYGYRDVTPVTINSNPGNFAAYYPAYLLFTINVDGKTVTRIRSYVNTVLASGNPVIVGIYAYGGTHYVVITKRVGSTYYMRDPYVANGKDIPFGSHYSFNKIFSATKVVIK